MTAPGPPPLNLESLRGPYAAARREMIEQHLWGRDIRDPRILRAMLAVPREAFVPPDRSERAYADSPLPIGHGQTISQPYIVAKMTEAAEVTPGSRVLEIGSGSGYQTAVLLALGAQVWGVELEADLAQRATERLLRLGYENFQIRTGDGYHGWPEAGPFNIILLAAAPEALPPPLEAQLAPGGRLIAPVGPFDEQELVRVRRGSEGLTRERLLEVRFVPLRRTGGGSPETESK